MCYRSNDIAVYKQSYLFFSVICFRVTVVYACSISWPNVTKVRSNQALAVFGLFLVVICVHLCFWGSKYDCDFILCLIVICDCGENRLCSDLNCVFIGT